MTISFDDTTLIQGLHNGNQEVFRQIYSLYYRALCYFAQKLIGNKEDAEDIAVDSLLKLLNKKADFDNLPDIKSFLFTVVKNACFDYLRRSKKFAGWPTEIDEQNLADESSVEMEMITAKVLQAIYAEVENLPGQCKEVFRAVFIQGKTTGQVAEEMGISPQTVLNHKSRAVKQLRASLLKQGLVSTTLLIETFLHLYLRSKL